MKLLQEILERDYELKLVVTSEETKKCSVWRPTYTLDNLRVPKPFQRAIIDHCTESEDVKKQLNDFCDTFKGNMVLAGVAGCGKTHMACACLNKFANNNYSGRYCNVADLYIDWLKSFNGGKSQGCLVEDLTDESELLILDDIGTKCPSEGFLDFLYVIINKRQDFTKYGTIFTTNLTSVELSKFMGDRIMSRMCQGKVIKFEGRDKRIHKF